MASAPTNINPGVLATFTTTNAYGGEFYGGPAGAIPIALSISSVGASASAEVEASVPMPFKARFRSVSHGNKATTGTAQFDLYNSTSAALLTALTTITTGTTGTITTAGAATEILNKGDIIQLRATTAGSSSITNLIAWLNVTPIGEADNPLPNASYTT